MSFIPKTISANVKKKSFFTTISYIKVQTFLQRIHTNANKHMKRYSTPVIIREMQIESTMRHRFAHIRIAVIYKNKKSIGKDVEKYVHLQPAVGL